MEVRRPPPLLGKKMFTWKLCTYSVVKLLLQNKFITSLDNFFQELKTINGENKKTLVESIVCSQQLSNFTSVSQDTGKWNELKTAQIVIFMDQ